MTVSGHRFCWVLNLDAELELARPSYATRVKVSEQLERYGQGAQALLGPNDVVVDEVRPSDARPRAAGDDSRAARSGLVGRAWCPTPIAVAKLRAAGVEPEPHPPVEVVRRVNHRRFACELGGGLDGQRYVTDAAALDAVLRSAQRPWLLKRPLAFAGRGQMRIYGDVDEKQASWIAASFRHDGVVVEPLVTPILEASLHGFVWRDGHTELGRVCVQEVNDRGVWKGIHVAADGELGTREREMLFERGDATAMALRDAGYFGPFGIDGYRYRDGERPGVESPAPATGFCPMGEINARYTMGFVTGFPRHPSTLSIDSP